MNESYNTEQEKIIEQCVRNTWIGGVIIYSIGESWHFLSHGVKNSQTEHNGRY
jgi:hypothetical protein